MLMAEDGPNLYSMVGGCEFEDFGEDMSFDADVLLQILETDSDPLPEGKQMENVFLSFYCLLCLSHESQVVERNAEVLPSKNVSPGKQARNALGNKTSVHQNGSQVLESAPPTHNDLSCSVTSNSLYNVEGLDSITGSSRHLFDSTGNSMMTRVTDNVGVPGRIHSPIHATSASLRDWISQFPVDETFYPEKIRVSEFEIPTRSTASSFANADPMYDSYQDDDLNVTFQKREPESQTHARDLLKGSVIKRKDNNLGSYGSLEENRLETNGLSENNSRQSFEVSLIDGLSSQNATSVESTICQSSDVVSDFVDCQTTMPLKYFMSTNDMSNPPVAQYFLPELDNYQYFHGKGEIVTEVKDESQEFSSDSPCSSSIMNLYPQSETTANSVTKAGLIDGTSDIRGWNYGCKDSDYMLSTSDSYAFQADNCHIDDKATENLLMQTLPSKDLAGHMNIELFGEMFQPSMMTWNAAGVNESFHSRSPYNSGGAFLEDSNLLWSGNVKLGEEHISSKLKRHSQSIVQETASVFSIGHQLNLKLSENYLSHAEPSTWNEQHMDFSEVNEDGVRHQKLSFNSEATHSEDNSYVENDPDISIIEDIGDPLPFNRSIVVGKSVVSQCSTISDSHSYMGAGSMRHKSQDEQLVLRVALQDLSQPKSEATPPDGLMAVPLLRHQKIALSWMVQKETASLHCMGGILADDQGLGKTVSTIALILKERPLFHGARKDCKQRELETLNLDEDDDDMLSENDRTKREGYSPSGNTTTTKRVLEQAKERPGAGTLVVCPTSVLRQWAEELQSKVTNEAKLSVLVYHGSNRTKDHYQLAKYDVVLTTYSIVSMEVPKQSMVNEDEDEKGKAEDHLSPSLGFSSSKKRKYPSSSDKSCSKSKKGVDTAEAVAGPLAKVLWFRVVLDEAQSIKNHRTQVARACWGLRAKRRWCLSGTPIQNAIDDLYSYFRFLKYDPYAAYKSFYSAIKMPITRNPSKGYKKLQAVLKTIMLRRTKATLLDGQPIISLPPKVIELKKVDFSKEERDFYTRLEADSRAQFEEYAAAGTVKQNYVNILLMLLRLRQACDHPLLVRPYDTNSSWRSSVDMAKQLPRDKQLFLLDCLEASLAICGICMDPPEDAVVTNCGHVFCKQCICERLSGDDYQCSAKNCKVRLSMSSVFSKSALDSALSDQASHDFAPDCSHSDAVGAVESLAESQYYESSKIRAAIEVLQSLCKPCDYLSRHILPPKIFDETNACPEKFSASHSPDIDERTCEHQNLALDNGSNEPIKVKSEKAIVFSQWTRMLDLLEAYLKSSSIQYRRLDGTMSVQARDKAVKDFNTLPEVSVMIMSLKAASLGLNMVAACHVLLLDLWWNPTTEDQAIDRAHRIGQTRPVKVLRLTVRDTVEDRILALQQKKREMVSSAFGEDGSGGKQTRLTVEDLKYLFMM